MPLKSTVLQSREDAERIHHEALAQGSLPVWTICSGTTDWPHNVIARMHVAGRQESGATAFVVIGKNVKAVRNKIPRGLALFARDAGDDLVIVETWL